MNRPERSPASPALAPATDRSWHGLPPQMISTGGSSAPFNFVMSPTWTMSGNRSLVTSIGKASISLAQTGRMPLRTAASGKPPMPSNKLPIVSSLNSLLGTHLLINLRAVIQVHPDMIGGNYFYCMYNLPDHFFIPLG